MSKRNLGERIKLQSYGEMFGEEKETEVIVSEQIKDVALSDLHPFKNHPFKVLDDEKMAEMVESVKQYGILVPAIARLRAEGGYELISGHRRHHAATLAGLDTMPVMIKDCDDDESTVIMVDASDADVNVYAQVIRENLEIDCLISRSPFDADIFLNNSIFFYKK